MTEATCSLCRDGTQHNPIAHARPDGKCVSCGRPLKLVTEAPPVAEVKPVEPAPVAPPKPPQPPKAPKRKAKP